MYFNTRASSHAYFLYIFFNMLAGNRINTESLKKSWFNSLRHIMYIPM